MKALKYGEVVPAHFFVSAVLQTLVVLIEAAADVEACDHMGWTSLHYAVVNSHVEVDPLHLLYTQSPIGRTCIETFMKSTHRTASVAWQSLPDHD